MKATTLTFHVVVISDEWGFDENTVPLLLELIERFKPDSCQSWHTGVTALFRQTKNSAATVEQLVAAFRKLRSADARFSETGIGHADGPMIVEINWRGRVHGEPTPVGSAVSEAVRMSKADQHSTQSVQSQVRK